LLFEQIRRDWRTGGSSIRELADRDVPPKQRHTARRIWQRLVAEHGARLAEVTVSRYVASRLTTPNR
jgi:hypothetical protein